MEWTLQQQGFDYCYDKRLYDRLAHESAESVRGHLQADAAYQERLVRFIENHDEPRAAATFGPGAGTRGGGRDVDAAGRPPVPRRPARRPPRCTSRCSSAAGRRSRPTRTCARFYGRLLAAVADSGLRDGDWRLCDVQRLAGQRLLPPARGVVLAPRAPPRRREPRRRARAGACAPAVGRPRRPRVGARRPARAARASSAPATSWRARACTSGSSRGRFTSCGLPQPISKRRSSKWTRHVPALNNATCSASRTSRRICWSRNCSRPAP